MPRLVTIDHVLDIIRILGIVIITSVVPIAAITTPILVHFRALPDIINGFVVGLITWFYIGTFLVIGSQILRRKVFPLHDRRFHNVGLQDERRTAFQEEPEPEQPDQPGIPPAPVVPLEDPAIPQQRVRIVAGARPRRYQETAM